jgi:cytochrome P450
LLSWILYRLCLNPQVQAQLRAECRASPLPSEAKDNAPLGLDELNALERLPLLDAILRETLRLDAPVVNTDRVPINDVVLPLSEPVRDTSGELRDSIPVKRGTTLAIPIALLNRLERIWGPDAKNWK